MSARTRRLVVYTLLWLGGCALLLPDRTDGADYFWVAGTGDWSVASNWNQNLVPEAEFEEIGVINNGGIATLSTSAVDAAGLDLGRGPGESGTLQILSGGSISLVNSTGSPVGTANIGMNGSGVLDVRGGGALSTPKLIANSRSTVQIGMGVGDASLVSNGTMSLAGTTWVRGAGHTFSAAQSVVLANGGLFVAEITSASHSPLRSNSSIRLGGNLQVQFSGNFAKRPGDTWDLFDAGNLAGSFANVDLSAIPKPADGLRYQLATVVGGSHGHVVQLQLQEVLRLSVNSATGEITMASPSDTPVALEEYSILSDNALLNVAGWDSLADQSTPGWQETSASSEALAENDTNPAAGLTVNATSISLGTAYKSPQQFGEQPDLQFEYVSDENETLRGEVEYTGPFAANNLLLTVNPATGEAVLSNSSLFSISLADYSILSSSGSLQPNDGDWSSLEDQGIGSWAESPSTPSVLSEKRGAEGALLSPGEAFSLGGLFDEVDGTQDLTLEFHLDGQGATHLGVIEYALLSTGDFNGDGRVDGFDFLTWQRGLSPKPSSSSDLAAWKANFGNLGSLQAPVLAVPEPTSLGLSWATAVAGLLVRRRRLA